MEFLNKKNGIAIYIFSSVLEKPEEGVVSIGSIPLRDQDFP